MVCPKSAFAEEVAALSFAEEVCLEEAVADCEETGIGKYFAIALQHPAPSTILLDARLQCAPLHSGDPALFLVPKPDCPGDTEGCPRGCAPTAFQSLSLAS
mmetsp:Transcript_38562/g.47785  ORF Transcript_38562/g.47785 Transcript_38562/m.47785 type:complete len:101 (-) Transcript_38562:94-396(-)